MTSDASFDLTYHYDIAFRHDPSSTHSLSKHRRSPLCSHLALQSMSSQESDVHILSLHDSYSTRKHLDTPDNNKHATSAVDLDAYASPQVYYGSTYASRKVAKSRTLSLVCQINSPPSPVAGSFRGARYCDLRNFDTSADAS